MVTFSELCSSCRGIILGARIICLDCWGLLPTRPILNFCSRCFAQGHEYLNHQQDHTVFKAYSLVDPWMLYNARSLSKIAMEILASTTFKQQERQEEKESSLPAGDNDLTSNGPPVSQNDRRRSKSVRFAIDSDQSDGDDLERTNSGHVTHVLASQAGPSLSSAPSIAESVVSSLKGSALDILITLLPLLELERRQKTA
jgi:hypothetical protein